MILRDPVHGLVVFEGIAERVVSALLATREVQRLRRVRQLGLTSLVFPGAEHTRFAHALGAAYVMTRLLARIKECDHDLPVDARVNDEATADAVAAAMLHDLGHGPFSHLYEEVSAHSKSHESWTYDAILDPQTDVYRALSACSAGMPERVAALLQGTYRLGYLSRAVSGTLDVDRADYLLRDSHMTGVRYGLYDLDWLLRGLTFAVAHGEHVLAVEGRKGVQPIESFFLGRHFMYQQVYHHKATRGAEGLIRAIFHRVAELCRDGRPPKVLPVALKSAALGEVPSLGEYLELDDARLYTCFAEWARGDDPLLGDLANRVLSRRLLKTLPLPDDEEVWGAAFEIAKQAVRDIGMRDDLFVWMDTPEDVPYYEPPHDTPEGMWVVLRHQPIRRLGDVSFLLRELRNKRLRRPRLIFPEEVRGVVEKNIKESFSYAESEL